LFELDFSESNFFHTTKKRNREESIDVQKEVEEGHSKKKKDEMIIESFGFSDQPYSNSMSSVHSQLTEYKKKQEENFKNLPLVEQHVNITNRLNVDYGEKNEVLRQLHFEKVQRSFASMLFI
jgi:hypothetical protein